MSKTEKVVETVEEMKKPYTLRPLKDKDMWIVLDILGKVFPDELSSVFAKVALGEKNVSEVGAEVIMKLVVAVLKNIGKVHDDLYAFLSDVSGIPAEEIPEMEFGTTPGMIWDIVGDAKNLSFFKAVAKLS